MSIAAGMTGRKIGGEPTGLRSAILLLALIDQSRNFGCMLGCRRARQQSEQGRRALPEALALNLSQIACDRGLTRVPVRQYETSSVLDRT